MAAAATVILATSAFAAFFGSAARMYALVMLLVLLGALALLRTLERPTVPRALVVALCSGALLLSHYWTVSVLAMVGLWLVWSARARGSRRAPLLALACLAGGAILFAPWLPSFLFQIRHTGTPWISPPSLVTGFQVVAQWSADAQSISFADSADPGIVAARLLELLLVGLSALGLFGRSLDARRRVEVDLLGRPIGRELMVICFGAVTLGVLGSIVVHSGFQPRYSAPMFVLLPLLAGLGVLTLPDRLRLPTLAAVAALGLVGASSTLTNHHKTRPARLPRRCAPRRHLVTSSSTARTSWPRRAAGWCSRTPAGALLRRQRPVAGGLGGLRRPG